MLFYKNKLFHDSIANIPAPTRLNLNNSNYHIENEELFSTKFISKIERIHCRWDEYCSIPSYIIL